MKLQTIAEARKNPDKNAKVAFRRRLLDALSDAKQHYASTQVFVFPSDDYKFTISSNDIKNGILVIDTTEAYNNIVMFLDSYRKKYAHIVTNIGIEFNFRDINADQIYKLQHASSELGYNPDGLGDSGTDMDDVNDAVFEMLSVNAKNYDIITTRYVTLFKKAGYATLRNCQEYASSLVLVVDPTKIKYISTVEGHDTVAGNLHTQITQSSTSMQTHLDTLQYIERRSTNITPTEYKQLLLRQIDRIVEIGHTMPTYMDYDVVDTVITKAFKPLHVKYGDVVWQKMEPYMIEHPTLSLFEYAIFLNKRLPKKFEAVINTRHATEFLIKKYNTHFGLK
jgi:hypothetical protein